MLIIMIESPELGELEAPWHIRMKKMLGSRAFLFFSFGLFLFLLFVLLAGRSISRAPAILTAGVVMLPVSWAAYGLTIGGLSLFTRNRPLALLAVVSVGIWFGIWGHAWIGDSEMVEGEPVSVLNWNLQRLAWSEAGGAECILAAVERLNPDVLALTEVSAEEVDALSVQLDLECVHVDYMGTDDVSHGGLASCVRGGRWEVGYTDRRRFTEDQDWYYSFAEFRRNDAVFNLITVHLRPYRFTLGEGAIPVAETQAQEADGLIRRIAQLRDPTVLAGDFNSPRDSEIHVRMRNHLRDTWEVGGWGPARTVRLLDLLPMRVDYIYASRDFAVARSEIPDVDCSDHRPVLSQLILQSGL